jgi:hypothetical protein
MIDNYRVLSFVLSNSKIGIEDINLIDCELSLEFSEYLSLECQFSCLYKDED